MSLNSIWRRRSTERFKAHRCRIHIIVKNVRHDSRHELLVQFMETSPLYLCHVRQNDLKSVSEMTTPDGHWVCSSCLLRRMQITARSLSLVEFK